MNRAQFIQYLVHQKLLDVSQQKTLNKLNQNVNLCYYLVEQQLIDAKDLAEKLAQDFCLPLIDLHQTRCNSANDYCFIELISKYHALPVKKQNDTLLVAISDPNNTNAIEAFKAKTKLCVKAAICPADQLAQHIQACCKQRLQTLQTDNIIELVDQIFEQAITQQASDVHFEPYQLHYRIRYRIDGLLKEAHHFELEKDLNKKNAIVSRLKILSHCDIAEQRLPQDGHFKLDESHHCRLSTCPTVFGEKIVCRILNPNQSALDLTALGFNPKQLTVLQKALTKPQGFILVSGPTGSGKSMTLSAALNHINLPEKNICSVEDPVEIQLPGVNQVSVQPNIGFDFAKVLRTFLRQDPDIIMIGEIRDKETAEIALKAAQTGHLVLATVHANNAKETIDRLVNLKLNRYALSQTLTLVIAQRLLRKKCANCHTSKTRKSDCSHCFQGYQGRTAIVEMIPFTEDNKTRCAQNQLLQPINTLSQAATEKMQQGITDAQEIKRVLCQ